MKIVSEWKPIKEWEKLLTEDEFTAICEIYGSDPNITISDNEVASSLIHYKGGLATFYQFIRLIEKVYGIELGAN